MNQCFLTSVTAWLREETSEKILAKILYFLQKSNKEMSIKFYRNCDETIMDVLLNFGPNWKRNDEQNDREISKLNHGGQRQDGGHLLLQSRK
jgi:hypothetical protein